MRKSLMIIVGVLVLLLTSCGKDAATIYNFDKRQDGTYFSNDGQVIIEYKTDTNGEMIELNIDRLLTIEEMFLQNPNIDLNYELAGFTGDIFMKPANQCTAISNDLWIPINIEIGNTRYKFNGGDCRYETVDTNNEFKIGFADEYYLTDTITENKNTTISIVVYNPNELVRFIEIYELPHTYELLGAYSILLNEDRSDYEYGYHNYYQDMGVYEQLYWKHQENAATIDEIKGMRTDINIMDLQNLTEVSPLITDFET